MKSIVITLFLTLSSQLTLANNALRGKNFNGVTKIEDRVELQVNPEMTQKVVDRGITSADVATIIPTDIPVTNNETLVRDRILNKSLTSFLKSPMMMNTFLMKTAKKVEETTSVGVKIKPKSTGTAIASEQTTDHKFDFNVEAFKREARITYTGFIDSKIEYRLQDSSLRVSIEENLTKNSRIALTHQATPVEQRQYLFYQVNW